MRSLDADSAPLAMADPLEFRTAAQIQDIPVRDSTLSLTLSPLQRGENRPVGRGPGKKGLKE